MAQLEGSRTVVYAAPDSQDGWFGCYDYPHRHPHETDSRDFQGQQDQHPQGTQSWSFT